MKERTGGRQLTLSCIFCRFSQWCLFACCTFLKSEEGRIYDSCQDLLQKESWETSGKYRRKWKWLIGDTYSFSKAVDCGRAEHECVKHLLCACPHVDQNLCGRKIKELEMTIAFWCNLYKSCLKTFKLPLCESSFRGCLLGGELLCSLSGYILFRELLKKKNYIRQLPHVNF